MILYKKKIKVIFWFLLAFFRNIFSRKFYMYDEILSGIHRAERKMTQHTKNAEKVTKMHFINGI